jgi:pimeloyl-ACP methyl ester carboxylesterase
VIDQLILGRLAPRDAKVLLVGHSRGGLLSLLLAGERPALAKAVINFSGGWYGVTQRLTAAENQQRMDDHKARLARAAARAAVPTLWFYAARDPFYKEGVPQELRRYWQEAGGRAEFVFVAEHSLPNAHLALSDPKLWEPQADALLKTAETAKR